MKALEISVFGILMGFKFKSFWRSQLLTKHMLFSVRLSRNVLASFVPCPCDGYECEGKINVGHIFARGILVWCETHQAVQEQFEYCKTSYCKLAWKGCVTSFSRSHRMVWVEKDIKDEGFLFQQNLFCGFIK